jgi:hypothetical protein
MRYEKVMRCSPDYAVYKDSQKKNPMLREQHRARRIGDSLSGSSGKKHYEKQIAMVIIP